MTTPVKLYQQEMHENLGYFANWLPSDPIEIGDVGTLEGGRFRGISSLKELGVEYQVRLGDSTQNVNYTSTKGTKILASAGAAQSSAAKAEITISFSQKGAFVFNSSKLQAQYLENRMEVGSKIVQAYQKERWQKEWLLVESTYIADNATIIISEESSAEMVLSAKVQGPITAVSLGDPKVKLAVSSTRGKMVHVIGGNGVHPLYSCLRLKDPLWGQPSLQPVRGTAFEENPFSRVSIDDLLNS